MIPESTSLVSRVRSLLALLVFATLLSSVRAADSSAPRFQVNALSHAPSISYGAPGSTPTHDRSDDPRVQQIADWLRQNLAQLPANPPVAQARVAKPLSLQEQGLARLYRVAGDSLQVKYRPQNSIPMWIRGDRLHSAQGAAKAGVPGNLDEQTARAFLRQNRDLLRIQDPDAEFRLVENKGDELGRRHLRFEQWYQGLPVFPCELLVHLDPDHNVDLFNGSYIPTPAGIATDPAWSANRAKAAVLAAYPDLQGGRQTEPDLIVYGPLDRPARLAWRLEVHVNVTTASRFIVDAQDGSVLNRVSLVHDAAVAGMGTDATGISRTLSLWQDGGTFYMIDTSKSMFDPTSTPPNNGRGTIEIFDAANREVQDTQFSAGLIRSASASGNWDGDAVGAAFGLSQTYDYYLERFGRNSLNGAGGTIRALVHYGNNVANAFWYGTTKTMVFGAGFTREIDISGHELTHGVIDSVGNGGILEYQFQPGALNESLADIFGEMVEARFKNSRPDWLKADPFDPTNRDKLLQDYSNPGSVSQIPGRPNPSKMSEFVQLSIDQDQGGVHINSSIINHCFYLLAEGMDGALGMRDAEKVFYRAMTTQLQKQSQFIDMRLGCVVAAEELFGRDSTQARKTREAFDLVEIHDAPETPDPTPIPTVNAPDSVLFLRYDALFDGVVLGRREQALGDPVGGTILNTGDFVLPRRISVSGDGAFAVFVTADHDIGFLRTDGSANPSFANLSGEIHSVAMAPNATRFAVVLQDPFTQLPQDEIVLVDLNDLSEQTVKLLAPVADGTAQDIVKYADSMDFLPDGNTLVYDAVSEIPSSTGAAFQGWNLFSMDVITKKISTIINLDDGVDFGNPSLGNVRTYLLTHEVIDRTTGVSTIYAADLRNGAFKAIATLAQANVVGFPVYTGDDKAIVYTQVDLNVPTTVSLYRQELADDGITPVGQPTLWLADADRAAVYRRGTFNEANVLPQVSLTSPAQGQVFPVPANITVTATATDTDGTIATVQFFIGSTMIGEDSTAPYSVSFTVENPPASGTLRLTARAIDNVGGQSDSAAVDVKVGSTNPVPLAITVQPQSQTVQEGSSVTFSVTATGGRASLSYRWQRNGVDLGVTSNTLQLSSVPVGAAGDYTVTVSDGTDSVTSAAAKLIVTPRSNPGSDVRLQARLLAGGLVQLNVTGGKLNDLFTVQVSSDLKTWATLSTVVKTGDVVSTVDTEGTGARARFYRVSVRSN